MFILYHGTTKEFFTSHMYKDPEKYLHGEDVNLTTVLATALEKSIICALAHRAQPFLLIGRFPTLENFERVDESNFLINKGLDISCIRTYLVPFTSEGRYSERAFSGVEELLKNWK